MSIADPQTAVNALENGEVDALESVAHDLLSLVEKRKGIEVQRGAYASQYALRPNWLHPPFNDPGMRLALGYADRPEGTPGRRRRRSQVLAALQDLLWLRHAARLRQGARRACSRAMSRRRKALLKEAGYDGRPIVLLQVTDLASLANLGPVAKAQLERVGFKVDMRPADWQTHLARVMRKEPPEDRGWNITLSSTGVHRRGESRSPRCSSTRPATRPRPAGRATSGSRRCARPMRWSRTRPKRKAIAEEIQERALQLGTHYPLGEWYSASAVSAPHQGLAAPALDDRLLERRGYEALRRRPKKRAVLAAVAAASNSSTSMPPTGHRWRRPRLRPR